MEQVDQEGSSLYRLKIKSENDAVLLVIGAYRLIEKEFGRILIYDIFRA
jgi:hypothetical protein